MSLANEMAVSEDSLAPEPDGMGWPTAQGSFGPASARADVEFWFFATGWAALAAGSARTQTSTERIVHALANGD